MPRLPSGEVEKEGMKKKKEASSDNGLSSKAEGCDLFAMASVAGSGATLACWRCAGSPWAVDLQESSRNVLGMF